MPPAFPVSEFIQDPIEYETRTHRSNMDGYDRLEPDDLNEAAVMVASFVYNTAMRDQILPRKPMEKPLPREPEKKRRKKRRNSRRRGNSLTSAENIRYRKGYGSPRP